MHTGNLGPGPGTLQTGHAIELIFRNFICENGEQPMLWTITIILFILWVVGLVSSYTLGGWIHILLVLAIIVLIFNLLSGRRAL